MSNNKQNAESLLDKAKAYLDNKQIKQAFQTSIRALQMDPAKWEAYLGLGTILQQMNKNDAALVCLQRASHLNSDSAEIYNRLGNLLRLSNRHQEALSALGEGLKIDPEHLLLNYNMALLYKDMNELALAEKFLDKIIARDGTDSFLAELKIECRWLKGLCSLSAGEYRKGWGGFESRLDLKRIAQPTFPGKRWQGEPLQGKTIFLTYEQRFGDVIHTVRFIPQLSAMGAIIIVQSPKQLFRLLQTFSEIDRVVDVDETPPSYDYHLPITSLMPRLDISLDDVPGEIPYISVSEIQHSGIPEFRGMALKVGLVWAGKPKPDRSCPLPYLIPLLKRQEVGFYSFQMGPRRKDIFDNNVGWMLHDLSPRIDDFYFSAQLMQQMDLIITIDSAPAHLAGALGKPVWMLVIYSTDWRWMIAHDRTPWYPTMRLFRQEKPGCWEGATLRLEQAFDEWVDCSIQ